MTRRSPALALALVVGAALAAFAPALRGSFVNWDDEWLVLKNPYLRGPHHVPAILDPFGERTLLGAEYLPVRDLSNLADFSLFGTEPTGYRLGNWLLHGLAAGLAYALLREALRRPAAALAGALLWAVHPLHAEVVAWASARKDLLNAVFALLASTLWLRSGRTGSRGLARAAAGVFLLATLSKASAAALPIALAAWEALSGDGAVPPGRRLAAALRRAAPLLAVAAAGAALHALHQSRAGVEAEWRGGGWLPNLFLMAGVHLRYLRQVLLPTGLAADYRLDEGNPYSAAGVAGLAVLLAGLAGTVLLARRRPAAGAAALWWFLLLLPVSNLLFPITNASADRYLFLPSLGPCALAGLLFDRARAPGPRAARAAVAALAAAALALGAAAALQCRVWRDGVALWDHAVAVSPDCGRAWMNRGEALADAGRKEEALASFRRMTEVDPANPLLWVHAGNRLFQIAGPAEMAEVRRLLEEAVRRAGPGDGAPFAALGWLLDRQGAKAEGVRMLEEAVRRQPGLSYARYNLGIWHAFEGRFVRAAEELEEAIRCGLPIDLEMDAHDRLVRIYDERKASGDARLHRAERERLRALTWGE